MWVWLLVVFFIWGCQGPNNQNSEKLYVDDKFSSQCDAYRAISKFATSVHLTKDEKAFDEFDQENSCTESKAPELLKIFVHSLDPHSYYFSADEMKEFQDQEENIPFGIGVEFKKELVDEWVPPQEYEVEEVFPNSPSFDILRPGIILTAEQILKLPKSRFLWSPVFSEKVDMDGSSLGYIKIRQFTLGSAEFMRRHIEKLQKEGVEGFLIDIRLNPGGRIDEATKAVGMLRGRGEVVRTLGNPRKKYPPELEIFGSYYSSFNAITGLPILVLANQHTASAAEIFAGGLELDRAVIVGERTFGKGTGFIPLLLSPKNGFGGALLLTSFRSEFPDHFSPQAAGIAPSIILQDNRVREVVNQRNFKGLSTILVEEDYGYNNVISNPNSDISRVYSRKILGETELLKGLKGSCSARKDCQKADALALLNNLTVSGDESRR